MPSNKRSFGELNEGLLQPVCKIRSQQIMQSLRVPPKEDREDLKRMKMSIESSLEEFICHISHELPLEPVIALDAQIYERCEIEEWIKKRKNGSRDVTSPATNQKMGEMLAARSG